MFSELRSCLLRPCYLYVPNFIKPYELCTKVTHCWFGQWYILKTKVSTKNLFENKLAIQVEQDVSLEHCVCLSSFSRLPRLLSKCYRDDCSVNYKSKKYIIIKDFGDFAVRNRGEPVNGNYC